MFLSFFFNFVASDMEGIYICISALCYNNSIFVLLASIVVFVVFRVSLHLLYVGVDIIDRYLIWIRLKPTNFGLKFQPFPLMCCLVV